MDKKTLRHIARLSRISLTDEELEKFTHQMQTILDSAKVLQEINTNNVKPMKRHIPFFFFLEDITEISLTQEDVLKNATYTENGYVKVFGKIFDSDQDS